ncbi:hypothetical protein PV10_00834 [Exophiala mesophila]|uniref:Fatty acid hydroxylase domain-containing protein n=1 Tax=Exophiala mesophila TaxID=212818 RepID=A0A0D1X5K6_EXOME|nr:uncharacterized protein PV10_00834 [Exophiala mesophila]KIV97030.1 hypothetical protein PV10_00834 [Exophiala mesophila]
MVQYNPACYLPASWSSYIPNAIACPPPPSLASTIYNYATWPFTSTYGTVRSLTDALIGLPFLSFLLIPTVGSYSTSLNLLFFYLTWSTLVLSHPPLRVEIIGTLAVRIFFYIIPSLFFVAFDVLLPSAAENFKALGDAALPFKDAKRKQVIRHFRIIGWSLLNIILSVAVQGCVEILFTQVFLIRSALRVTTTLPLPFGILKDITKGYLVREILAYVFHRYLLHEQRNRLSHGHSTWYHSLSTPFPLSASYDHPASYLVRSFLPTYLPAVLFRFHLLTYIIYLTLVSVEETFAYSGYSTVPTNFILGGMARRTDTHVLCGGEGNYGPWGLIDWVMGSSVGDDVVDDIMLEADKHDVPARVEKRVTKARGKANGKAAELKDRLTGERSSNANGGASPRKRRTTRARSDS